MIKVPVAYVPRAHVDFDAEARQILGQALVLPDGFRVPPLTAGRLIALEIVSSPFFLHPFDCDPLDAAAAIVLLSCDRKLVEELVGPCAGAEPGTMSAPLAEAAAAFLKAHGEAMVAAYDRLVDWILDVPFYGLTMIPGDPPPPREFWFDGTFAGGVVAAAAKLLATPFDRVLWEVSLCAVGHALAQQAAAYGVKHVERPPDKAALKRIMQESAAREKAGILHPWQFEDPISYSLTDTQANANPALIELFARMRAEYEKNGHKPLDPAKFPIPCASEAERTAAVQATPAAQGAPATVGIRFADITALNSGFAVADPSGARSALPTITVEGLPSRPCGASTEKESVSVYV